MIRGLREILPDNGKAFSSILISLKTRNFRLYFTGMCVSLTGDLDATDCDELVGIPPDRFGIFAGNGNFYGPNSDFIGHPPHEWFLSIVSTGKKY